jgi:hypothetical protein
MEELEMKGAFVGSLKRSNKNIRDDRAAAIAEAAEMKYKRKVEDLNLAIKVLARDRNNMLDMSPANTMSLMVASDFDADVFVTKDIEIGMKLRELEITRDIAQKQYELLFTDKGEEK